MPSQSDIFPSRQPSIAAWWDNGLFQGEKIVEVNIVAEAAKHAAEVNATMGELAPKLDLHEVQRLNTGSK